MTDQPTDGLDDTFPVLHIVWRSPDGGFQADMANLRPHHLWAAAEFLRNVGDDLFAKMRAAQERQQLSVEHDVAQVVQSLRRAKPS